jgi:hypothetical protein
MVDDTENFDKELLDDPDARTWLRIQQGSEPDVTYEEYRYFENEAQLKALAKKKGWIRER